jgi:mono/diheme cytochrome c family protein
LREGVRADGKRLYPAMPYTSYTLLSDADVHALYTYFMRDVKPVNAPAPRTDLSFPFSMRSAMIGWDLLFNRAGRFAADPHKSAEWNRGAYLANGLAHCSSCHTPRNVFFAENLDRRFEGAHVDGWYAPSITADPRTGIGAWSRTQLVEYLKTGDVPGRALAAGPMADAIDHSLSRLDRSDLDAIATYLLDGAPTPRAASASPAPASAVVNDDEALVRGMPRAVPPSGAQLFSGNCASCHQVDGRGTRDGGAPSLVAISDIRRNNPDNLIMAILDGVGREGARPRLMPAFADDLDDEDVATLVNYVRGRFGAPVHATPVSAQDVQRLRTAEK